MRYRTILLSAVSVLSLTRVPAASSVEQEQPNRIPAEFQGRWVRSADQCAAPAEGWLYISPIALDFREGSATVVSVRRIEGRRARDVTVRVRCD